MNKNLRSLMYGVTIGGSSIYLLRSKLAAGNDSIVAVLLVIMIFAAIANLVIDN